LPELRRFFVVPDAGAVLITSGPRVPTVSRTLHSDTTEANPAQLKVA
jgi:hypothetical protein